MHARIQSLLPNVKAGTLRMWGEWFGKPYDNVHRIVECAGDNALLSLGFEGGEKLSIWQPEGLEVGPDTFSVKSATKVRWEWDYYGRPKLPQNRYFREFVVEGSSIFPATNVDWYAPKFEPSLRHHAAELL
jgi:hypothetical protein